MQKIHSIVYDDKYKDEVFFEAQKNLSSKETHVFKSYYIKEDAKPIIDKVFFPYKLQGFNFNYINMEDWYDFSINGYSLLLCYIHGIFSLKDIKYIEKTIEDNLKNLNKDKYLIVPE